MHDELEKLLRETASAYAPRELRGRVLAGVELELARRKPRWDRRLGIAVAATLVLGVTLNLGHEVDLDRVFAPTSGSARLTQVAPVAKQPVHQSAAPLSTRHWLAMWFTGRPAAGIGSVSSLGGPVFKAQPELESKR